MIPSSMISFTAGTLYFERILRDDVDEQVEPHYRHVQSNHREGYWSCKDKKRLNGYCSDKTDSFLNQLMELTALTEVDAVVVDVCGEKQEARQGQAVL